MPKTFGRNFSEKLSPLVAMILVAFYYFLYPVVKIFMFYYFFRFRKECSNEKSCCYNDDIEVMVEMAEEERTIDSKQLDLLSSILEFPSIKRVKDIMVSRTNIEGVKEGCLF